MIFFRENVFELNGKCYIIIIILGYLLLLHIVLLSKGIFLTWNKRNTLFHTQTRVKTSFYGEPVFFSYRNY